MSNMYIKEQAVNAFAEATVRGYVSESSTEQEVRDVAYEVLQFMPAINPDVMSDSDYEFAVECLLGCRA